jgi:hypothetical protein
MLLIFYIAPLVLSVPVDTRAYIARTQRQLLENKERSPIVIVVEPEPEPVEEQSVLEKIDKTTDVLIDLING